MSELDNPNRDNKVRVPIDAELARLGMYIEDERRDLGKLKLLKEEIHRQRQEVAELKVKDPGNYTAIKALSSKLEEDELDYESLSAGSASAIKQYRARTSSLQRRND